MKKKNQYKTSWLELPAFMLPSLLLLGVIFYTAWAAWWI